MFGNLKIIGKGSNPFEDNAATISLDKDVLRGLDLNRPTGGYPAAQERAIAEMRQRIADYEAVYGEVY